MQVSPFQKIMAKAESMPYRRTTRLSLSTGVTIRGKDDAGCPWERTAQTVDVSRHGARIMMPQVPSTLTNFTIASDTSGRSSLARVIWCGQQDSRMPSGEIGIEWLEPVQAESFWRIEAPPEDWLRGSLELTPTQKLGYLSARNGRRAVDSTCEAALQTADPRGVSGASAEALPEWEVAGRFDQATQAPSWPDPPVPQTAPNDGDEEGEVRFERKESSAGPRIQQSVQDALTEVISQLTQFLNDPARTISPSATAAAHSTGLTAEEGVAKLQSAQEMAGSLETSYQSYQKRLEGLAASSVEEVRRNAEALHENLKNQLQKTAEEFERKASSEFEGLHRKAVAEMREHCARQREELAASANQVVEEARAITRRTLESADSQARVALEEYRKGIFAFRETFSVAQNEIEQVAKSHWESTQRELARTKRWRFGRAVLLAAVALVAGLAPATIAVYLLNRPVLRLRADPPSGFLEANSGWNAKRRAVEEQLARAYWDCAVRQIQVTYHKSMDLPDEPAAQFKLDSETFSRIVGDVDVGASRNRYWQRLREVWRQPQAWKKSDELNLDWIRSLGSFIRGIPANSAPR